VALRSEDTSRPIGSIADSDLHKEEEEFGAYVSHQNQILYSTLILFRPIIDDNFEHALRICKDKDSKCIRLQASVLRGEMKRYAFS